VTTVVSNNTTPHVTDSRVALPAEDSTVRLPRVAYHCAFVVKTKSTGIVLLAA